MSLYYTLRRTKRSFIVNTNHYISFLKLFELNP